MKKCCNYFLMVIVIFSSFLYCAKQKAESPFQVSELNDHVIAILDGGGNSIVVKGKEGCVVVDAKDAEVAEAFKLLVEQTTGQPIQYLVNTHWHADHVMGNAVVGAGAIILAHENTRKHMVEGRDMTFFGGHRDPYSEAYLPDSTFTSQLTLQTPDEVVELIHPGPGHTDGDVIVWLAQSNILQTGDIYFNGMYPYIGIEAGGSINFMIDRVDELLNMTTENTVIVPGHGPISNQTELAAYLKMLVGIRDAVQKLIDDGMDEAGVIAAKPTQVFDPVWANGFLNADDFARLVYMDLSR